MRSHSILMAFSMLAINSIAQTDQDGFSCGANEQPGLLERIASDPRVLQHALDANEQLESFTAGFDGTAARNDHIIPMVFHIIHNNGTQNISDEQILDAVRILNEDLNDLNPATATVHPEFADLVANVGIQFQLARKDPDGNCTNGITRTVSPLTFSGDFEMTQLIQWPRNRYLNIWVSASANGAAGYTYYPMWLDDWPEADGIVILHNYVGSIGTSIASHSHVLTHEVGHWLNLKHCWGNSNEPGESSNCDMDDDVEDTPLTKGWTSCPTNAASCGSDLDNVENYMEYSYCYKMFTLGQADRMLAALNSPIAQRNELWSASTLAATGLNEAPTLCAANFTQGRTDICAGGSIQFHDISYHSVVERNWSFPGGDPSWSNEPDPIVTYNEAGIYPVTLEVSDGNNTLTRTENSLVHVSADPGIPMPYVEGFENMDTLPDGGWWAIDPDGDNTFEITNVAAYSGERCVVFTNGPGANGRVDELRSPSLDLENATGLSVSFRYAFARRSAGNDDRLRVHFSPNCGTHWSLRKQLRASATLTTAGEVTGNFVPQSADDWELAVIDIPSATFHVDNLLMRFEFLSDGGNHLYIDDINIHGTPVGIEDQGPTAVEVPMLVPNPAEDLTDLILNTKERSQTRIVLRDVLGREMDTIFEGMLNSGTQRVQIPLHDLAPGVYLINIEQGLKQNSVKLIKE